MAYLNQAAESQVDILLVDDTPANLLTLESVLTKLGQNIVKASSGREALKILLQRDFALILLDINMPGLDGFETASLIRQRKNSEHTPIIFITAYGNSEVQQSLGYSLGAVDYIFSPVVPEILQSKAAVFVELHKKTIQVRKLNEELRKHAKVLEEKVEERTKELSKANKELIRLNKIKSEFTSMVSHELRTPLTAIKEGIELVLEGIDGPVTQDQVNSLSVSKSNVDRLAKLIQNVLDFSKLESGEMEMFFEKANLNLLVQEVYALMNPIAHKKGIHFKLTIPEETLQAICDADKIKQLLINLIDNAIKFTDREGVVGLELFQKNGSISVEVEDTGIGIKKDYCEKIFEMFAQIHQKGGRRTGGVGIGLAVCKQIAKQHHGTLTVASTPGKGTKFLLSFPTRLTSEAPPPLQIVQQKVG